MCDYSILPENLQGGMRRYIENRIEPGLFLRYCLENDFVGAVGKASDPSYDYLHRVASFLWNELPFRNHDGSPWGSADAVKKYLHKDKT